MGNDGVHDLDIACWGLGVTTHPTSVAAVGGKYFFDDDQQFPDTQYVVFEYAGPGIDGKRQLIFEQRIWSPYVQEGYENGNAFYGTEGMMLLGKRGGSRISVRATSRSRKSPPAVPTWPPIIRTSSTASAPARAHTPTSKSTTARPRSAT